MRVRRIVFSRGVTIALALVAVVILGGYGLVAFRAIPPQPNIFAEIYADTEKNYERNPAILQIQTATQEDSGFLRSGPPEPEYRFKKPLKHFDESIGYFDFDSGKFYFKFSREESGIKISEIIDYSVQSRTLTRRVSVKIIGNKYVDDVNYEAGLLQDAGITRADLEDYYRTVVDDYILTDWVKVYGSNFSPTDYGEITIIDEWDRYFEQDS